MVKTGGKMNITYTEQQISAIEMVFSHKISILSGKPGTGKTTVIKAILDRCDQQKIFYRLCAPTGKAAKRMIESTGRMATTIHSLLGVGGENRRATFALTYHVLEWVTTLVLGLFCLGQLGLSLRQVTALANQNDPVPAPGAETS